MPDDRGARPRWLHARPAPGVYGRFVVDRLDLAGTPAGEYFGALVDYQRNFPEMPSVTRVFEQRAEGLVLWMSDGPQEVSMMAGLALRQRGHVLVTGLGLGIVQQRLLAKPGVTRVTTLEASTDVIRLHEDLAWFADPRHKLVTGTVEVRLEELVRTGRFDGYVLDHWDTVDGHLAEKVGFLKLLSTLGQGDRPVSMWGFWWEVEATRTSDDEHVARLLAGIERCRRCGAILGDPERDGPDANFSVLSAGGDPPSCEPCSLVVD